VWSGCDMSSARTISERLDFHARQRVPPANGGLTHLVLAKSLLLNVCLLCSSMSSRHGCLINDWSDGCALGLINARDSLYANRFFEKPGKGICARRAAPSCELVR
jgi:hypothetical protein